MYPLRRAARPLSSCSATSYLHDDAARAVGGGRQAVPVGAGNGRVAGEVGCGGNVTTVRQQSEGLVEELSAAGVDATLVRINPDLPLADDPSIAPRVVPVLYRSRRASARPQPFGVACQPRCKRGWCAPPLDRSSSLDRALCPHRALALALPRPRPRLARPPPRTSTRRPRRDPTDRSADTHTLTADEPLAASTYANAPPVASFLSHRSRTRAPWGRRREVGELTRTCR